MVKLTPLRANAYYHVVLGVIIVALMASYHMPIAAQQGTPTAGLTLEVLGRVTSGTAGLNLPPTGLPIKLHVVMTTPDNQFDIKNYDTLANTEGTFVFSGVTTQTGATVFVTTTFDNVTQGSALVQAQTGRSTLDLSFMVYGGTDDPNMVRLSKVNYQLDFKAKDTMSVLAVYSYRVTGDRYYLSTERNAQNTPLSVTMPLPIGAFLIGLSGDDLRTRYSIGGTTVAPIIWDTRPVFPGQPHDVVVSYQVPYQLGATIDQDYPLGAEAIDISIPDAASIVLNGDFDAVPATTNTGEKMLRYTLKQPLASNGRLIYTLEGRPHQSSNTASSTRISTIGGELVFVFAAIVILVGLLAFILLSRRQKRSIE